MRFVSILLAGGAVSYLLRVAFVTVLDPDRLPEPVQRGLAYVGPASMATLATTAIVRSAVTPARTAVTIAAVGVAAIVARVRGGIGVAVTAAIATAALLQAVLG